jgi:hypothetical protein
VTQHVTFRASPVLVARIERSAALDRYGHLFPGAEGEAARALDAYLDRTIGV